MALLKRFKKTRRDEKKPKKERQDVRKVEKRVVEKEKPKLIMEIGTAKGGTLFLFSKIAEEVISVDKPFGSFGYGYTSIRIPLYKSFSDKVHLIRGDSLSKEIYNQVDKVLEQRKTLKNTYLLSRKED